MCTLFAYIFTSKQLIENCLKKQTDLRDCCPPKKIDFFNAMFFHVKKLKNEQEKFS